MSDGFHAAWESVVRAGASGSGTLRYARTSGFDSLDPGNTYYAFVWNFVRLIGRPLLTYRPVPGPAGRQLVPDLATGLGEASEGGLTWTYHLRRGVRYEDGGEVTAADVRHAIVRSNFRPDVLSGGPTYFRRYLAGPEAIEVPDEHTLVFRLREPFEGFDYLAALPSTVPVPERVDTGREYGRRPLASGPWRVDEYHPEQRLVLTPNPRWDAATDPVRRRGADRIEVDLGVPGEEVDRRLLANEIDIDLAGVGVQPATLRTVMDDPVLRARADNPLIGFTWIYAINPKVPPFDNVHCRRAVQYATDKLAMQTAYGGPLAGKIATTILPPTVEGHAAADRYPCGSDQRGDLAAARAELVTAGRPDGFEVRIAARVDRLKEYAAAQALAASLDRAGMTAEVVPFQSGDYFSLHAGVPEFVHRNRLGIIMFGWAADFPDGFGFFQQIVDGRAIKDRGNHNFAEVDDPTINGLLDLGARSTDPRERAAIWQKIDQEVMEQAYLCPYLWAKSLLYRGPRTADVHIGQAWGMYDYATLGVADDPEPGR